MASSNLTEVFFFFKHVFNAIALISAQQTHVRMEGHAFFTMETRFASADRDLGVLIVLPCLALKGDSKNSKKLFGKRCNIDLKLQSKFRQGYSPQD